MALSVFQDAKRAGIKMDSRLYTAVIPACRQSYDDHEEAPAYSMLKEMRDLGFRLDAVAYASAISTCAKSKRWWSQGLRVFDEAKANGAKINMVMYNTAMAACQTGGQSDRARSLLEEAKSRSLRPDVFSYNTLIASVSKSPDQRVRAHGVRMLKDMTRIGVSRNVVSFSSAISCCENIENGWAQALSLYHEMRSSEVAVNPNSQTYTALLRTLVLQDQIPLFQRYYAQIKQERPKDLDSALFSSVAQALMSRNKRMEALECVKDAMQRGLRFSGAVYGKIIEDIISFGHIEELENTIIMMQNKDIPRSNRFVGYIETSEQQQLGDGGRKDSSKTTPRRIHRPGSDSNGEVGSSEGDGGDYYRHGRSSRGSGGHSGSGGDGPVMHGHSQGPHNQYQGPRRRRGGEEEGSAGGVRGGRGAAGAAGKGEKRRGMGDYIRDGTTQKHADGRGSSAGYFEASMQSLVSAIHQQGRNGRWRNGLQILRVALSPSLHVQSRYRYLLPTHILDEGIRTQNATYLYTAAMSACQKAQRWDKTLELFTEMEEKGVPLDCPAYTLGIHAMGQRGLRKKAIKMLTKMRKAGVRADNMAYTAAIIAADRMKNGEMAITVLRRMIENGLKPDRITYNAVIKTQERCVGRWQSALELVDEMRDKNIQPDERTYNTIISACKRSNEWEAAFSIALNLKKYGIQPSIVTINTVISALDKGGKWQAGIALFRSAKERALAPDHITYTALIISCANANAWAQALELVEEMRQDTGVTVGAYNAAIDACDRNFQFTQAAELESQMQKEFQGGGSTTEDEIPESQPMTAQISSPASSPLLPDEAGPSSKRSMQSSSHETAHQQTPGVGRVVAERLSFVNASRWGKFSAKALNAEQNEDRTDVRGAAMAPPGRPFAYFAVYDGHGGAATSQWLKENLALRIDRGWDPDDVQKSIRYAYLQADKAILEPKGGVFGIGAARGVGGARCGASAATAIMYKSKQDGLLYMVSANVGNSVVILKKRNQEAEIVSALHVPENATEYQRIAKLNSNPRIPLIRESAGRLRLGGSLSLTRAFGDAYLKPISEEYEDEEEDTTNVVTGSAKLASPSSSASSASPSTSPALPASSALASDVEESPSKKVNQSASWTAMGPPLDAPEKIRTFGLVADPDVSVLQLDHESEWMVVASNGLTSRFHYHDNKTDTGLSISQIQSIIQKKKDLSPNDICYELAYAARQQGSRDDITVVYVPLGPSYTQNTTTI